jgi:uncharacterized protein (DUF1778 family)
MSRPTKAPSERKEITLKVRVTAEQQRRLTAAATMVGMELSTWIRATALDHADGRCFGVVLLKRPGSRRRRD